MRVNKSGTCVYPHITVICGSAQFAQPDKKTTIVNPQIVIEVCSQSSEADDRGEKFTDYRRIESLQEYFLVLQDRHRVDAFYRQPDGVWAIGPSIAQLDQSVIFRSLGIEIPLSEIYDGIEIPSPVKPSPSSTPAESH